MSMQDYEKVYEVLLRRASKFLNQQYVRFSMLKSFFENKLVIMSKDKWIPVTYVDSANDRYRLNVDAQRNAKCLDWKQYVVDEMINVAKHSNVCVGEYVVVNKGETLESIAIEHDLRMNA